MADRKHGKEGGEARQVLLIVAGTVAGLALMALLWTASGLYNVAASKPHWTVTEAIIAFGLNRSVATHSLGNEVPVIGRPAQIRLGAAHFEIACASCHGSPNASPAVVTRHMLPPPPSLDGVSSRWKPEEIAWIVEHGLKYTGMPAWPAQGRADEIWAVVSFLRALPMPPESYRALAGDEHLQAEMASPTFCRICHALAAAEDNLVPPLEGQSAAYLARALNEYADGSRPSGIMGPIAVMLSPAQRNSLASWFAGAPTDHIVTATDEGAARGAFIARNGIKARDIPACLACHDGKSRSDFPILAGLPAAYISGQLQLWQRGGRLGSGQGEVMATIARRLSREDIRDLAVFFAGAPR